MIQQQTGFPSHESYCNLVHNYKWSAANAEGKTPKTTSADLNSWLALTMTWKHLKGCCTLHDNLHNSPCLIKSQSPDELIILKSILPDSAVVWSVLVVLSYLICSDDDCSSKVTRVKTVRVKTLVCVWRAAVGHLVAHHAQRTKPWHLSLFVIMCAASHILKFLLRVCQA